jgi:hypothetical protein
MMRPEPEPARPSRTWRRVQTVLFIIFCLEMGLVLVLFPWSSLWDRNYFFRLAPEWSVVFASSYLRGAVSGVGLINVWIALSEAWRLRSL